MRRRSFAADELAELVRRSQAGRCFLCAIARGDDVRHEVVYEDELAIAFLNRFPTQLGYTLVAPKEHREHVTADFPADEYVALQRVVHRLGEALRRVVPTERLYVLSLGRQHGNRHVHWHVVPLPPGVPYAEQQLAALDLERAACSSWRRPSGSGSRRASGRRSRNDSERPPRGPARPLPRR